MVVTSSTVRPIGVNTACCMTRIGATKAGLPRMYVAIGRPMLLEFRYSEFNAPMVASAAFRWKNSLLRIRNTNPTSTAEKNATTMEEWNISKILLLGQDGKHQARARYEKAEPVEHHLRGRSAYAHARGHVTGADDDANDAEAFQCA